MEIWKQIKDYDYEVSTDGRIRSMDHKTNTALKHQTYVIKKGKILKPMIKKGGYLNICLCNNNIKKTSTIHRLVAETFIPKVNGKDFINHKNAIKTDNRVTNLEWCTSKENTQHALKLGLIISKHRKKILCVELNKEFDSSYQAAQWLNENKYSNSKNVRCMSRNIRTVCSGKREKAFGYKWKDLV